jgi:CheY-like chemotaxis protein
VAEPPPIVVLVVEDHDVVRCAAAEVLEEAGYLTLEADSAADALVVLAARSDVAVVFTDVEMPGAMDGAHLARLLALNWPWISVILTSSVTIPATTGEAFLAKPYRPEQLLRCVKAAATAGGVAPSN